MSVALQISSTGPSAPDYPTILLDLQNQYRAIFGSDIDIDPDSQDGQMLAIFAQAIFDTNQAGVAVYNSFSPATAAGTGLSSVVKINGIARLVPTASSVDVLLVGVAGTVITNGIVADNDGNQFLLPVLVVIPISGDITVTATATEVGAINSPAGTVTTMVNPQPNWQSVTNPLAVVPGAPLETDAALRRRQAISTMIPANTILEGILGSIAALPGVTEYAAVENDHDAVDSNGIPGHTIAVIVEGGDAQTIANTIEDKKCPGAGTYGTTVETVFDQFGIPHLIKFYRPTIIPIKATLTVKALVGFTTIVQANIAQAITDYLNSLPIGQSILITRLYVPANLNGSSDSLTYELLEPIKIARDMNPVADADVTLLFHEQSSCNVSDVIVTVTT